MFFQISYYYTVSYRVTMSALAAWTAMLKGSWPCSSTSVCDAPLFRNRHTWLYKQRWEDKQISLPYRVPVLLTGWPHAIRLKCSSLGPSLTCGHLLRPIPSFPVWFLYKTSPKALNGIIKWISPLWPCQAHHVRNISTYLLFKTSVY